MNTNLPLREDKPLIYNSNIASKLGDSTVIKKVQLFHSSLPWFVMLTGEVWVDGQSGRGEDKVEGQASVPVWACSGVEQEEKERWLRAGELLHQGDTEGWYTLSDCIIRVTLILLNLPLKGSIVE